jgi:hypothetical protein
MLFEKKRSRCELARKGKRLVGSEKSSVGGTRYQERMHVGLFKRVS